MLHYVERRITREQFLACINVGIEDTATLLGGDVVQALKQPIVGKKADVRKKELPIEETEEEPVLFVADAPKVNRRVIGATKVLSNERAASAAPDETSAKRRKRVIRVRD